MGSDHSTATGKGRVATTQDYSSEEITLMREIICSLSKPAGNVGQHTNGNLQYLRCQCEIV